MRGRRECPRSSHTGDSMIGTPVATLPDASGKASVSRLADLGSKPDLLVRGGGWGEREGEGVSKVESYRRLHDWYSSGYPARCQW